MPRVQGHSNEIQKQKEESSSRGGSQGGSSILYNVLPRIPAHRRNIQAMPRVQGRTEEIRQKKEEGSSGGGSQGGPSPLYGLLPRVALGTIRVFCKPSCEADYMVCFLPRHEEQMPYIGDDQGGPVQEVVGGVARFPWMPPLWNNRLHRSGSLGREGTRMLRLSMVGLSRRRGSPEEGIGHQGPPPLPLLSQGPLLCTARHIEKSNEGKEAPLCECP